MFTIFGRTFEFDAKEILSSGLGAPIVVVAIIAMMIIPLPTFLLDLFFTFNLSFSLIILLVVIYTVKPLDFAAFPTVILVATILRLSLNVASTRIVLMEGHAGGDAAGKVIAAFGEFVVGGNFAVGLVVFIVLIIINFMVVTKGAGRVAEVTARFTLDKMPGQQMAIDADLNAGMIDQDEAQERRTEIQAQADFFGSMDGASKFVRGDAVAGILITLINVVGGLAIGMMQHELAFAQALETYVLLAIGDGLVAQIPGLLLSVATAMLVTRSSEDRGLSDQFVTQLGKPKPLFISAVVIGAMGLIPGMPNFSFLLLSGVMAASGYMLMLREKEEDVAEQAASEAADAPPPEAKEEEVSLDDVQPVDILSLEVGYRLIPLVDKAQGGELLDRIRGVRKKLSQDLGFLVQPVHIRDNLDLQPNGYQINLMGVSAGEGEVHPDRDLAINPGQVFGELNGIKTVDPSFGLEAVWIEPSQHDHAQTLGYTVVDTATVAVTHLSQVVQNHAHMLLGSEEVQQLLDRLKESAPQLVEELVPKILSVVVVRKVLQNLLHEGVPIRDLRTILETMAEEAPRSQDPDVLTPAVRVSLGRTIVQGIIGSQEEIPVITLDPSLEQILQQSMQQGVGGGLAIEPGLADRMMQSLAEAVQQAEVAGNPAILLVSPLLRVHMSKLLQNSVAGLYVLAYNEVPDDKRIEIVSAVGQG